MKQPRRVSSAREGRGSIRYGAPHTQIPRYARNDNADLSSFFVLHSAFCIQGVNPPTARRSPLFVIHRAPKEEMQMDDIERNGDGADDDEQLEQMIVENSILLHSLAALLVRKGILKQEEIDDEMDKLYEEMEKFEEE
jgi:hypothetical protein